MGVWWVFRKNKLKMKFLNKYNDNINESLESDLRKIGEFLYCKKTLHDNFTKGKYYNVKGFFGDPKGAIEKEHIFDYLPVKYISIIELGDIHPIEDDMVSY